MRGQKGLSLQNLTGAVMVVVVTGIFIAVGLMINGELNDQYATTTVGCEAVTWAANSTTMPLANPYIKSVEAVYNGTCAAANILLAGNYTVLDRGILLTATGEANFGGGIKYVNYTTWTGTDRMVAQNSTSSLAQMAGWLPIIGVVLAAAVILGMLVVWFKTR